MKEQFERVVGYENVKQQMYQIIDMFKNEEIYNKMGAHLVKGVLLTGEPGVGKSLLIDCFIKACGLKSYTLRKKNTKAETLAEISKAFEEAALNEPSIINFEDLDKFSESEGENVDDEAFVAIQSAIDSVKDKKVLVVASVNNFYKLPKSLVRSGRFDRRIRLTAPSHDDAYNIIKHYLSEKQVSDELNYTDLARMINYTNCADLEKIINESAIYAAYERKPYIEMKDIIKAYLKMYYDISDVNYECSDEELFSTCLHEASHLVVAEVLKKSSVGFACVNVEGNNIAAGFTFLYDNFKRRPDCITVGLAGKAGVETFLRGRCGSGCQSDLHKVMNLIRDGISTSGTNGLGLLDSSGECYSNSQSYLERSEAAVTNEMERYMFKVKDILIKNKDFVYKIADALFEKRILLTSDIERIRNSVVVTEFQNN